MSTGGLKTFGATQHSEVLFPFAVMVLIVVLIIPLPPMVLDVFLTMNIGTVILLLLVTLGVRQALELSVFPSAILVLTLARLSLNVATTRQILLHADAGKIVSTFGDYVVGGNLIVGLVVFLILIIIQFVVITKGATRISEVGARFILDAMPGKQMAIDADLNAGIINDVEARRRREHLMQEAEFYGSMDGASKFVRGDAIAGLVITAINLIGGIGIGLSNSLPITEAMHTYSILTIGDGLVSQIPALIVATAAGILITKSTSDSSLGPEFKGQFFSKRTPLRVGAGMLLLLALFAPGLPTQWFLALAGILWWISVKIPEFPEETAPEEAPKPTLSPMEEHLTTFLETDRACVEIGAKLIPIVDPKRGLSLLQRIGTLRRDLARRSGLWVPLVRVRDNVQLEPEEYRIMIGGQQIARGALRFGQLLAIHPQSQPIKLEGIETHDPAFGLAAKWIAEQDRAQAEIMGCTVVDAPSVLITHLREVLRRHASELMSREDLESLVQKARETASAVVDELIPNTISMGVLHRIVTLLLEERVPVTNLTRILESISNNVADTNKDPRLLADCVRRDLSRAICDPFVDDQSRIHGIVFDPMLELELRRLLHDGKIALGPEQLEKLIVKLAIECREASNRKQEVALLVDTTLRAPVRQMLSRALQDLTIIAFSEVPNDLLLEPEVVVKPEDVFDLTTVGAADPNAPTYREGTP